MSVLERDVCCSRVLAIGGCTSLKGERYVVERVDIIKQQIIKEIANSIPWLTMEKVSVLVWANKDSQSFDVVFLPQFEKQLRNYDKPKSFQ